MNLIKLYQMGKTQIGSFVGMAIFGTIRLKELILLQGLKFIKFKSFKVNGTNNKILFLLQLLEHYPQLIFFNVGGIEKSRTKKQDTHIR